MKTEQTFAKRETPFLKIKDAAQVLGVSQCFLRTACRENKIPFFRAGAVYMVDIAGTLEVLHRESQAVVK